MIGVIADAAEHEVAREFFELFKTPWEFFREGREYDVLLYTGNCEFEATAKLVIFYGARKLQCDDERQIGATREPESACIFSCHTGRIPIYGGVITFAGKSDGLLRVEGTRECAAYVEQKGGVSRARIGYDLFDEVRTLLTVGQPHGNANIPTLELHIALLRNLITGCGISLVEIPPVPEGFQFIACLTHDVDHPSVRNHNLDHTIVGFLLRATFGSLVDAFLGRMSIGDMIKNWVAVLKLPFVYIGLAKDFWADFDDRYLKLEQDLPSTYFLIPRKNYPGKRLDGSAPALRASRYEAKELADIISRLRMAGREVGLHGIDAWVDGASGSAELEEIRRLTGVAEIGVRMHWLYFSEKSPETLEKAGAAYDSTVGYNETVGYRAGTAQAYKPLEAERLLELPMHAMDTALFYLSYLALPPRKASARLRQLVDTAVQYGGCLTINWHDRSLGPERFWGGCYRDLIQDLKNRGAWFATAGQAVAWFRKRRAAVFESNSNEPFGIRVKHPAPSDDKLPALRLRVHKAKMSAAITTFGSEGHLDVALDERMKINIPLDMRA
jgi:hypothetical protein